MPVMGLVAEGGVEIRANGQTHVIAVGHSFDLPTGQSEVTLTNPSSVPAKILTFEPAR